MVSRSPRFLAFALAAALLAPATSAPAEGGDGDRGEARVTGTCSKGSTARLRLRSRDGTIGVRFEVKRRRGRETWRIVLVHERRIAWRGTVRTRGSNGSFRVRRSLADLDGPDRVTARASGPRGHTCVASAAISG